MDVEHLKNFRKFPDYKDLIEVHLDGRWLFATDKVRLIGYKTNEIVCDCSVTNIHSNTAIELMNRNFQPLDRQRFMAWLRSHFYEKMTCSTCSSTYLIKCRNCDGIGKDVCYQCKESTKKTCKKCDNTGILPCVDCNGSGQEQCYDCDKLDYADAADIFGKTIDLNLIKDLSLDFFDQVSVGDITEADFYESPTVFRGVDCIAAIAPMRNMPVKRTYNPR